MGLTKRYLNAFCICNTLAFVLATFGHYQSDKVLLSDVKAITLHQGQMTNARRSSPVPQLKCVGGSAQHKFQPKVVQCINQGSDGNDIQWECKTDMDNAYRFGHVEVSCEGYDYPNDPFVLKGSCGLEYTVDFTDGGYKKDRGGSYSYSYNNDDRHHSEGGLGGLLVFGGIMFAIYVIYKTCLSAPTGPGSHSGQSHPHHGHSTPSAPPQPPPYGFKPEYTPGHGSPPPYAPPSYESSTGTGNPAYDRPHTSSSSSNSSGQSAGGGFWTGAATGGLLGYLFGQSGNRGYNNYRSGWNAPNNHYGSNRGWGFSSPSPSFSRSSSSSSSSGSRMTSGFGGTSRR